jgi:spoIIIJ-associated protein
MATEHQEELTDIVTNVLEKMGFSASVKTQVTSDGIITCQAEIAENQNLLIGQHGINLAAIQHLVRVMLRKRVGERTDIIVDINGYFAGKREALEREAEKACSEALENNISVALRPMLPYERKIIHSHLAHMPSVTTESIGKGEERKVLVRPKPTDEVSIA